MLVPVILSGGSGTRLWPVSREAMPKPFMKLGSPHSLPQRTLIRALPLADGFALAARARWPADESLQQHSTTEATHA